MPKEERLSISREKESGKDAAIPLPPAGPVGEPCCSRVRRNRPRWTALQWDAGTDQTLRTMEGRITEYQKLFLSQRRNPPQHRYADQPGRLAYVPSVVFCMELKQEKPLENELTLLTSQTLRKPDGPLMSFSPEPIPKLREMVNPSRRHSLTKPSRCVLPFIINRCR